VSAGFVGLGLTVVLAVHAVVATVAALAVAAAAPSWLRREGHQQPARRARRLLALALLPSTSGLGVSLGLVAPAWLLYEPRGTRESGGPVLLLLAALGTGLALVRLGGALRAQRATTRLVAAWARAGRPLPGLGLAATCAGHPHPVAVVAGVLRPRLLLSESLLAAITPEELGAVAAHERAHVAAHDNLKRLLLRASPDPLALLPAGRRLREAFERAAEEAADAAACAQVPRLALARALLKVAALTPPGEHLLALPVAALHREGSIVARVHALVHARVEVDDRGNLPVLPSWPTRLLLLAAASLAIAAFLPNVHGVLERLVHFSS
jgi:Zn-dependent protease with chaperone function